MYDITLVIGFFNVINGTFIPGFSILSGIFRVSRVFGLTRTTLLLTLSITHNDKRWLVRYLLDLLLVVLIELYKNTSVFFAKGNDQCSVDVCLQYGRDWSGLSNIRSTRFYEVKLLWKHLWQRIMLSYGVETFRRQRVINFLDLIILIAITRLANNHNRNTRFLYKK